MTDPKWAPLLTGALAAEATADLHQIGQALKQVRPWEADPSLANGHAGLALFWACFAEAFDDESAADCAEASLDAALDRAGELTSLSLFGGITGLAWTHQQVERRLAGEASAAATSEADKILLEAVASSPWRWEHDLVYGLAGIGCYALSHPDKEVGERLLTHTVDRLGELAVPHRDGVTWRTPVELLHPRTAEHYPQGYYNLGLAHGVPGIIAFLSKTLTRESTLKKAEPLVRGAVSWLLSCSRPVKTGSAFSYFTAGDGDASQPDCRSAWCYGDPGVAVALFQAGHALGEPAWIRKGIELAARDQGRPFSESGVVDAGLCHGATGLAHLYNRLFQVSGEAALEKGAVECFAAALRSKREEGFAGYASWWPESEAWHPDPGLLSGAAGIGLALLAAISGREPTWDQILLLPALERLKRKPVKDERAG